MAKTVTTPKVKKLTKVKLMERLTPFLAAFQYKIQPRNQRKRVSDVARLIKKRGYSLIQAGNDYIEYDEDDNPIANPAADHDIWVKAYTLNRETGVLEESETLLHEDNVEYSVVVLPYYSLEDDTYSADCYEGLIRTKKEEWSGLGLYEGGHEMSSTELYNHIFQNRN